MSAFFNFFCACVSGKRASRIFGSTGNLVYFDFKALLFFIMSFGTKILFNSLRSKNTASQIYSDEANKLYFSFSASAMPKQYWEYQTAFCALYRAIYSVSAALLLWGAAPFSCPQVAGKTAVTTALYTGSAFKTFFWRFFVLAFSGVFMFTIFSMFYYVLKHVLMFLCLR